MGVPKPIIRPARSLVVSSAHRESGTALTDEGLLLGNTAFGSVTMTGLGCQLRALDVIGFY
jgi:hypothetical protein